MKARHLFLSLATGMLLVAGSSASADDQWLGDRGDNWEQHIKSTKSRAAVIADLNEARAQQVTGYGEETRYPQAAAATGSRSRDAVRAEGAQAARNAGRATDYIGG